MKGLRTMKPIEQIRAFLAWFCNQGVTAFDIHVRTPRTPHEDYKTGNWIWLTNHENVTCVHIMSKLMGWLRQRNANGSDVFFRPHKSGRHNVIFLDDVPVNRARAVLRKYGGCAIETHPGNTQIWLKVDRELAPSQRKQAQILLRDVGFTDPGSVAGDHLGRICGFVSQKRKCWVNLVDTSDEMPWSPELRRTPPLPPGGFCASKKNVAAHYRDTSDSGREWGWVMGMLRSGMAPVIVTQRLVEAAAKRGKPNALRYAQYTVQKAVTKLDVRVQHS
jgi:hypothetical protein